MKKILKIIILICVLGITGFIGYLNLNYSVPILMYHSLDKEKVNTFAAVDPQVFRKQMDFIKKNKYNVISLASYCSILKKHQPLPRHSVIITFDDGYGDNLPGFYLLKELGFKATLFLPANNIDKTGYIRKNQLSALVGAGNIEIGSHTINHVDLAKATDAVLKKEIADSKTELEAILGKKVQALAYPGGAFNEKALQETIDAGYLCACTTNRGFSQRLDRFALRRIKVTNDDSEFSLWAKLSGFYNIFKKAKKPY
jgi:peptidoglycan/xylan/chitin deacetylase (PgdA/CDA1 family)